jgi:hypothetical protein
MVRDSFLDPAYRIFQERGCIDDDEKSIGQEGGKKILPNRIQETDIPASICIVGPVIPSGI